MRASLMRVLVACAALTSTAALNPQSAGAGTTGFLFGSVIDEATGRGVPDEIVTATAPSATAIVRTDAKGRYSIMALPPDVYVVTARRDGYETTTEENVGVWPDESLVVNLATAQLLSTTI